ncbi:MAG: tRNA-dihydrouridine synthase family protein [Fibrobacter sp.]|uniref:tRNA dihydrouridine synthase n=1 Tax=Fibrobacter sp. TaxID=35828 RepID=UPI0025BF98FF|nr:tRNA-dihydrouridine synthase family protein [Fibrobacter sp.]MBQ3715779.1 tRNA-dihydrouridine synthase family protein [Fibrobacter sp.]MBQ7078153.1 tRNA-dihydrouridine synthase family protein [Fibrobacter sp.]
MLNNFKIPKKTSFRLRSLDIFPNTILSPMDGVTDAPFRRLCRVLSGDRMGLLVSEFVPTDGDAVFCLEGHKQLKFFPEERPFGVQIFGRFPDKMAAAARKIAESLHPDYIEVNAGCPAPKVAGKGSGSGLLRDLPRLQEILHDVRAALDGCGVDMPLTLKCRIGWDSESINIMETLAIAEGEGVEMLTVHGRTRLQGYNGLADWDWIGKAAAAAKIPVIGNGDVNSVARAFDCIENYGVAGVAIGRGAMHNPWIFGQIADAWEGKPARVITAAEALDVFKLYYGFKIEDGSTDKGAEGRLKQLAARLCKGFSQSQPGTKNCHCEDRRRACRERSVAEAISDEENIAMQVRQALLSSSCAAELLDRAQSLKEGIAKDLVFDPDRLVNLNGAKETELKFGDQFKGR